MIESEVMDFTRTTYTVSNQHDAPLVTYVKSLRPSREYKLRRPPAGTVETAPAAGRHRGDRGGARYVKLDEEKAAPQSEMQALIGRDTVEGAAR